MSEHVGVHQGKRGEILGIDRLEYVVSRSFLGQRLVGPQLAIMALNEDDDFSVYDATSFDSSWVDDIEGALEDHAAEWGLSVGKELSTGLKGYLVEATTADGVEAVLKIRRADGAMRAEVDALRLFAGRGVARLLATDVDAGVSLIEKVTPGTRLGDTQSADFDTAMAELLNSLPKIEPDGSLMLLAERAERWAWNLERFEDNTPLDSGDLKTTAQTLHKLAGSQSDEFVLHGDLHVENVLRSQSDGWVAIDPKGFAGERLFDAGWWMSDPPKKVPDMVAPVARRFDILTEAFDYDMDRVLDWAEAVCTVRMASRVAAMMWPDAERHAKMVRALRTLR